MHSGEEPAGHCGAGGVGDGQGAGRLPREVTVEWRPEGCKGGSQRHICGAVLGRRDSDSLVHLVTLRSLGKRQPCLDPTPHPHLCNGASAAETRALCWLASLRLFQGLPLHGLLALQSQLPPPPEASPWPAQRLHQQAASGFTCPLLPSWNQLGFVAILILASVIFLALLSIILMLKLPIVFSLPTRRISN